MVFTRAQRIGAASAVALATLVLVVGSLPDRSRAADHLDAPGLTSPGGRNDADINDVYIFPAADADRTVLVMTTHPLVGVVSTPNYATDVHYKINIDRNGDAVEDLAYVFDFEALRNGTQDYTVTRYKGENARTLEHGTVLGTGDRDERVDLDGQIKAFAGKRSDPFFFDLSAFLDTVAKPNPAGRKFCDANATDFFSSVNTNAIVLEVPTKQIMAKGNGDNNDGEGDAAQTIGVWATTIGPDGQIDRMGRPAINTVFNVGEDKNAFNAGMPSTDRANFFEAFENRLTALSGGKYTHEQVSGIIDILLPDMLTYDPTKPVAGPLNGRALKDDVIDVELDLVTAGAIKSDCVGPHKDYESTFPYVGDAH